METNSSLPAPKIVNNIAAARRTIADARKDGATVGLVPTMGSFHLGHISLMSAARTDCDFVAVSIFVNPSQFALDEDLETYPRNEPRDLELAAESGVDLVFTPSVEEIYPVGFETVIEPGNTATGLCASSRPGHFRGVLTVVGKLFNIFMPDYTYFGQKDAQQAAAIRRMATDLNFPVSIKVLPTVRDSDGLAMSSRNAYLTEDERIQATAIYDALKAARRAAAAGAGNVAELKGLMAGILALKPAIKTEYIEVVDAKTIQPQKSLNTHSLAVVAAQLGRARLIDNIYLNKQEP